MNNNKINQHPPVNQPNRPQTPNQPFPYMHEEVSFENRTDKITLSGTISLPREKAPFPAVILISGMGPNDRDYSMLGHKFFLVLADYLTRKGIAVLRFDKRGVGKSTGTYSTSLTSQDFAQDILAGIEYLKTRKDIDAKQIGLIGHSEGAIIGSMVAAKSNNVAFLVLMAGGVLTDVVNIVEQVALQLLADGATEKMVADDCTIREQLLEIVKKETNLDTAAHQIHKAIKQYWSTLPETQQRELEKLPFAITSAKADGFIAMFNSPWYRYYLNYNPVATLKQITVPVLALNGDSDFVTSSRTTLPVIEQALKESGNQDYTTFELPKMNHWFQECQTGAIAEYGTIEQTISPKVLIILTKWILERTNKP